MFGTICERRYAASEALSTSKKWGRGLEKKRRSETYATQQLNRTPKFTDPNIKDLPVVNNTLQLQTCIPRVTYTYGADVPGPAMALTPVPDVPLTRYNPPQRTYKGGAEKWPQWGWYPGANGFPVGKKGRG